MEGGGTEAGFAEFIGDVAGVVFRGDENEDAAPLVLFDEVAEELRAVRVVDLDGALRDLDGGGGGGVVGADGDAHGIAEEGAGEGIDGGRERGPRKGDFAGAAGGGRGRG